MQSKCISNLMRCTCVQRKRLALPSCQCGWTDLFPGAQKSRLIRGRPAFKETKRSYACRCFGYNF